MRFRLRELAVSVGQGWFVMVVGVGLGIYGAVELIAHSETTGWAWITAGLFVMVVVAFNVAYQALKKRDAVLAGDGTSEGSGGGPTIFHGGEHKHYYSQSAGDSSSASDQS